VYEWGNVDISSLVWDILCGEVRQGLEQQSNAS
jgi:hypothetical protein